MEENRFFTLIWRFNGLVIAVAGGLAIVLMAFVCYQLFEETTRQRNVTNVVNVEEHGADETWELGYLSTISGSTYVVMPLNSEQDIARASFSKSSYSPRNYLFVDIESDNRSWLLPHTDFLFLDRKSITRARTPDSEAVVLAFLYVLVKSDSNGDGRLTENDARTLALSSPDGSNYTEVLSNLDEVLGTSHSGGTSIFVVYQRQGVAYTATINLSDFSIEGEAELPEVGS